MTTPELSPIKRALLQVRELKARLDTLEHRRYEPLAIVGAGCRFPGGVGRLDSFWTLLRGGVTAVREVPHDRWSVEQYFDADADAPGKMYTRAAGFLDSPIDAFDAEFFGISPREARALDPQQRLLLEVTWEALENAGIAASSLAMTRTGVFVGAMNSDFAQLEWRSGDAGRAGPFSFTGADFSFLAGRLSYILGLRGPSLAIDTACSGSLVAVHLAAQSLRSGESDVAIAGGVNLILTPEFSISFSRMRALAPDGICKTFDAAADGYGRGEGAGVIVLKRLSDAVAAGDHIIGLVRGSAVNHGGPTSGLTGPSGPAQRQLISDALESATLDAGRVDYVEAHGTGTQLGDAIEVNAIAGVFGASHSSERPLVIGSVKANIGHLESASGVAGLMKVVAAMQAEEIPPQPHYRTPNPAINWAAMPVAVATAAPWHTADGVPRVAGVSSFGMSGTNAHVIIEEAPQRDRVDTGEERPLQVMRLSARNAVALRALASRHAEALRKGGALLGDVCFTANVGRSRFAHRVAVTGDSTEAMAAALSAFAEEQESGAIHGIAPQRESAPRIAFVFTGQGSQYAGMGRELYDSEPRFRAAVDRCAAAVADQMDLISVLYGEQSAAIDETRYTQPALFATGYALAEVWRAWGIEPSMVMGHSVGEFVAACVAGVFTPEDGMRLVAARGRLMQELDPGSMTAVFAHEGRVREAIAGYEEDVSIAAVNAPENIVISGRTDVVHQTANELLAEGISRKPLVVSHAFHSPMMEPMLDAFEQIAAGVSYQAPRRLLISNVTGSAAGEEMGTARYWREHVQATVQFERGVEALIEHGCDAVIEIGATATLLGLIAALPESHRMLTVASLRRNAGQWQQILTAAATLEVNGIDLDWLAFDAPYDRCRVPLPTYPFQRSRFWPEPVEQHRNTSGPASTSPFLGRRIASPLDAEQYEALLRATDPLLGDHRVNGDVIVPAVAYLEAALSITPGMECRDVSIPAPLVLGDREAVLQTVIEPERDGRTFRIFAAAEPKWRLHCCGMLQRIADGNGADGHDAFAVPEHAADLVGDAFYAELLDKGFDYGPSFRGITAVWRSGNELTARLGDAATLLGILDAPLQLAVFAATSGTAAIAVPFTIERVRLHRRETGSGLRCVLRRRDGMFNGRIRDNPGIVAELDGIVVKDHARASDELLYAIEWEPLASPAVARRMNGTWLIIGGGVFAQELVRVIGERGGRSLTATATIDIEAALATSEVRGIVHAASLDGTSRYESLDLALNAIRASGEARAERLTFVTRGAQPVSGAPVDPAQSPILGLARVAANELPDLRPRLIDLDPLGMRDEAALLLDEIASDEKEPEIAWRGGARFVPRLRRVRAAALSAIAEPRALEIPSRGLLEHLTFVPHTRRAPEADEVEVEIAASGLNFRDVLNALGRYPGEPGPLGLECAGRVVATGTNVTTLSVGDDVFGFAHGSIATHRTAPAALFVRIPRNLTAIEAATVPVTFLTAEYGLLELAKLKAGERVLIHAGAGGVGMAAIQIANRAGAEVFATASRGKWRVLAAMGVEHIVDSRSLSFADDVMKRTNGEGVDVVLNSLSGEFIPKSLRVLRAGGRFLEIGKSGVWTSEQVRELDPSLEYHLYDMAALADAEPARIGALLARIAARFEAGELDPLPYRVLPFDEAVDAFRLMAQGRHVGKIVLLPHRAGAMSVRDDATYLITGGLGSIGLRAAEWLVDRGARHLVLTSRTATANETVERLAARADVRVVRADVSQRDDVAILMQEIDSTMPPLRGVLHTAGVLDGGALVQQTMERFARVMAPKVDGSWNLHEATRKRDLDFFVLFSSMASMLGSAGQGNYAAANAYEDALAHYRRALGLPATSVNWGPWAEGGMATALTSRDQQRWASQGIGQLAGHEGFEALERALQLDRAQLGIMRVDWRRWSASSAAEQPLVAELVRGNAAAASAARRSLVSIGDRLNAAQEESRLDLLRDFTAGEVAASLGFGRDHRLDAQRPLMDLGVDSLVAVELRNALVKATGCALPVTLTFQFPTIDAIAGHLFDALGFVKRRVAPETAVYGAELDIDALDEAELARLLAYELESLKGSAAS